MKENTSALDNRMAAQQQTARYELLVSIPALLSDQDVDCRGKAQSAVADLAEDVCQAWLKLPEADRRAAILSRAAAAGAAAEGGAAAQRAGSSSGAPPMYKDVLFYVAGDSDQTEYLIKFSRASRAGLQKALDNQGCDAVQDPDTGELVTFDSIELRDNILLVASRGSAPWKARVSTLEGFVESSVAAFEAAATAAMYQHLQQQHSSVKVLPVRHIRSSDGRHREANGAVIADGCAAILEAKQELDDSAVAQLASCIEFIRDNTLIGPSAELKDKQLVGFLAGRTISSEPGKVEALLRDCQQLGYGIFVSSGRSLSLGNSRVPQLRVDCAMRKRACGGLSRPVRMVL
eukprot:GHRQ01002832.1.p1 GENE.GHRQ01002832.1~~GHRQ01002832.1.p1  ORF type:complete len:347 (+),score=81.20 GHRQ01002832.1:237-1277(+)